MFGSIIVTNICLLRKNSEEYHRLDKLVGRQEELKMIRINVKKIFLYILIIIVVFLVITAFYYNRHKFSGVSTIRYARVSLEHETSLSELANKYYSNNEAKAKFVSEIKKVNNIDPSDYIPGNSTIIIPIIEFE